MANELYLRLGNYPLTAAQVTQYYREAVAQFHLAPLLKSRLSDLSSGQKQTVAFALDSVPRPAIISSPPPVGSKSSSLTPKAAFKTARKSWL